MEQQNPAIEAAERNSELPDDEFLDDAFEDEFDEADDEGIGSDARKKSRLKLHCFHCNRSEGHFTANRGRWFHSYMIGFTFGLMNLVGPFRCRCCGNRRYIRSDVAHPKFWNSKSATKRSGRRKKKSKSSR